MNSIGQKLSDLRKGKHLSQEEAADKLGVTRQTISKWETDQSMPDFDKITSICNLYEISPNSLFGCEDSNLKKESENKTDNMSKRALGIAVGILIYFIAVSWMIVSIAALGFDPVLAVGIFLTICGVATVLIIYVCLAYKVKSVEKEEKNPIQKSITDCAGAFACALYFIISFTTMAWHITWIIWIIYALFEEIIKLIFVLKENSYEK